MGIAGVGRQIRHHHQEAAQRRQRRRRNGDLDLARRDGRRSERQRSERDPRIRGEAGTDDLEGQRARSDPCRRRREREDLEDAARPRDDGGGLALRIRHDGPARLWIDGDAAGPLVDVGATGHLAGRQRETEDVILLTGDERPVTPRVHGDRLRAFAHVHRVDLVHGAVVVELDDVVREKCEITDQSVIEVLRNTSLLPSPEQHLDVE